MAVIERKVYVCPVHGEVLDVVGMGKGRAPLHAFQGCGQKVEVVRLVPDTDLRGAVEERDAMRERCDKQDAWIMDAEAEVERLRAEVARLGSQ